MRGKGLILVRIPGSQRITPAYAGKSLVPKLIYKAIQDHPRLCGEKGFGLFPQPLHKGSPPPMRGKA